VQRQAFPRAKHSLTHLATQSFSTEMMAHNEHAAADFARPPPMCPCFGRTYRIARLHAARCGATPPTIIGREKLRAALRATLHQPGSVGFTRSPAATWRTKGRNGAPAPLDVAKFLFAESTLQGTLYLFALPSPPTLLAVYRRPPRSTFLRELQLATAALAGTIVRLFGGDFRRWLSHQTAFLKKSFWNFAKMRRRFVVAARSLARIGCT
jgi:hypothetical protein